MPDASICTRVALTADISVAARAQSDLHMVSGAGHNAMIVVRIAPAARTLVLHIDGHGHTSGAHPQRTYGADCAFTLAVNSLLGLLSTLVPK